MTYSNGVSLVIFGLVLYKKMFNPQIFRFLKWHCTNMIVNDNTKKFKTVQEKVLVKMCIKIKVSSDNICMIPV